jgi:hypothetical protein
MTAAECDGRRALSLDANLQRSLEARPVVGQVVFNHPCVGHSHAFKPVVAIGVANLDGVQPRGGR